jgi:hypothetical protein
MSNEVSCPVELTEFGVRGRGGGEKREYVEYVL